MKTTSKLSIQLGIGSIICCLPLLSLNASAQDYIVNAFDSDAEVAQWTHWWGSATWDAEFDPTVDADSNPNSGSMKVTINFDGVAFKGDNQFAFRRDLDSVVDGTQYKSLEMDVRFAPGSAERASNDYGYFEYGSRLPNYSQDFFGHATIPITNSWIHLETPIPVTDAGIDTIAGIAIKMWMGDSVTGTTTFWLDNVKLKALTNAPPAPAPGMGIAKAVAGLNLFASKPNSQYQRQSIRTHLNTFSWVGNSQPVTYSLTIANFPGSTNSGFQAHLFLVPGGSIPTYETSPDWNEANVIFLQIVNHADGTASGRLMYKTNEPNGNSMLWNAGAVATIASPHVTGTWSLSFSNQTATLTTPAGSSTNVAFSTDAMALFANPLYAYFGVQPNSFGNIGASAIFGDVQITGAADGFDDAFSASPLDPGRWDVVAEDPAGIMPVGADGKYWIAWTLPASGFVLQDSPNLKPGSWTAVSATNTVTAAGKTMVLIPAASLPEADHGFYRLMKQ